MAAWFSKKPRIAPVKPEEVDSLRQQPSRMQGLWSKCDECNEIIYRAEIEKNLNVCPLCGQHLLWPARTRLQAILDEGTFEETDRDLEPTDTVARELALFKVSADSDSRREILEFAQIFRGTVIDVSKRSVTIEVTGSDSKIEAFERMIRPFGLIEMVRTGEIAVSRGRSAT